MNSSDENDDLWNLLGNARPSSASPFFARNVVRKVRETRRESPGVFATLRRHWQFTAAAAVLCAVAVTASQFIGNDLQDQQMDSLMAITEQVSDSPDFYVINDLDDLLASEESSVWLDSSMQ